jgi:hypothetical protein
MSKVCFQAVSMSAFPRVFFVVSRFWVFLSDESSKTLQKKLKKYRVEVVFTKKSAQKKQNRFFLDWFVTFLGVSRRGEFDH